MILSKLFHSVSLGALGTVPLPLGWDHDTNALEMEPLQLAVRRITADHLRYVVVRTLAVTVELFFLAVPGGIHLRSCS